MAIRATDAPEDRSSGRHVLTASSRRLGKLPEKRGDGGDVAGALVRYSQLDGERRHNECRQPGGTAERLLDDAADQTVALERDRLSGSLLLHHEVGS